MTDKIATNVATCRRMAAAGSIAIPITSLPYPELESRTAKAVGGHIETKPLVGRRIRLSQEFITQSKEPQS